MLYEITMSLMSTILLLLFVEAIFRAKYNSSDMRKGLGLTDGCRKQHGREVRRLRLSPCFHSNALCSLFVFAAVCFS